LVLPIKWFISITISFVPLFKMGLPASFLLLDTPFCMYGAGSTAFLVIVLTSRTFSRGSEESIACLIRGVYTMIFMDAAYEYFLFLGVFGCLCFGFCFWFGCCFGFCLGWVWGVFRSFIGCLLGYFWLLCLCGFWGEGDESAWLVSKIGC